MNLEYTENFWLKAFESLNLFESFCFLLKDSNNGHATATYEFIGATLSAFSASGFLSFPFSATAAAYKVTNQLLDGL